MEVHRVTPIYDVGTIFTDFLQFSISPNEEDYRNVNWWYSLTLLHGLARSRGVIMVVHDYLCCIVRYLGLGTCLSNMESYLDYKVGQFHPSGPNDGSWKVLPIVRGIGTSLLTATNQLGRKSATYLSLVANITPAGEFGLYAGLYLLGCILYLSVCRIQKASVWRKKTTRTDT